MRDLPWRLLPLGLDHLNVNGLARLIADPQLPVKALEGLLLPFRREPLPDLAAGGGHSSEKGLMVEAALLLRLLWLESAGAASTGFTEAMAGLDRCRERRGYNPRIAVWVAGGLPHPCGGPAAGLGQGAGALLLPADGIGQ